MGGRTPFGDTCTLRSRGQGGGMVTLDEEVRTLINRYKTNITPQEVSEVQGERVVDVAVSIAGLALVRINPEGGEEVVRPSTWLVWLHVALGIFWSCADQAHVNRQWQACGTII